MAGAGFEGLDDGIYVHDSLIENGYFSDKLPPIFDGKKFLAFLHNNPEWCKNSRNFGGVRFNLVNNKQAVRTYTIPHPYAYAHLCCVIRDNWKHIDEHMKAHWSSFRYNQLAVRKTKTDHLIFEMNYPFRDGSDIDTKLESLLFGSKYVAEADVSNFFPSVYSHSICWAFVGRDVAYANKNDKKMWFNVIDKAVMASNNNESVGLPIGPHSSNIISDIILACVDKELNESSFNFVRYIDDYKCYARTKEEAEMFISEITSELSAYRLTLNKTKTRILEQPIPLNPDWKIRLKDFKFKIENNNILFSKRNKIDIVNFLDLAVSMHNEIGDAAMLRYAIKKISHATFNDDTFSTFEKYMLQLLFLYPNISNALAYACSGKKFVCDKTEDRLIEIMRNALKNKLYGAASFMIYILIRNECGSELNEEIINDILISDDCILILLFSILQRKNSRPIDDVKQIISEIFDEGRTDEFWLLIYEMYVSGNIDEISRYPKKDCFEVLKNHNVSFLHQDFALV